MIVDAMTFNPDTDYIYTKPKVNPSGGKNIGILNAQSKKGLYLSTPLMLTWGVNEFTDDKSGRKTYDMSLQFPKEEYDTPQMQKLLANVLAFEAKLKSDAVKNSKDWMNKAKMSTEVVDALWTPMVKYPKDQTSGEPDFTRAPTLRLKIPIWDDEWKVELYDLNQQLLFPNDKGLFPPDLIGKATHVATVMQCGGLWFANGKFGVTWKLVQAVVKPKQTLRGQCFISLSSEEKETLNQSNDDVDDGDNMGNVEVVDSSDEDDGSVHQTPESEVQEELAAVAPAAPKKKVVPRKKKSVGAIE
jgi:hypothetical protein